MNNESDWMTALRGARAQMSLQQLATRLHLSPTTVHQVLKGNYKGNLKRVAERVRGELLNKRITCPVLGEIAPGRCQDEQRKPFAATNPQRVQLWKTCRGGCRHSTIGKERK